MGNDIEAPPFILVNKKLSILYLEKSYSAMYLKLLVIVLALPFLFKVSDYIQCIYIQCIIV